MQLYLRLTLAFQFPVTGREEAEVAASLGSCCAWNLTPLLLREEGLQLLVGGAGVW